MNLSVTQGRLNGAAYPATIHDRISCIAVDDGERSWSFDVGGEAFGLLAPGDTVAVRASPRSGMLLGLMLDRDRAPGEGPPAPTSAGEPAAAAAAGDSAGAVRPGAWWAQRRGPRARLRRVPC